jgi:hypothetical protein
MDSEARAAEFNAWWTTMMTCGCLTRRMCRHLMSKLLREDMSNVALDYLGWVVDEVTLSHDGHAAAMHKYAQNRDHVSRTECRNAAKYMDQAEAFYAGALSSLKAGAHTRWLSLSCSTTP